MKHKKILGCIAIICAGLIILGLYWFFAVRSQPVNSSAGACGDLASGCAVGTSESQKQDWTVELTMDQALKQLDGNVDGVYYFGYDDCPWCQDAAPILQASAQEHNQKVYYIRTRDEDHNLLYDDDQKKQIIAYFGDYMETNEEGELTLYVPMVVQMKDAKVQKVHIGTLDSYDPEEREMNEEEVQELKNLYDTFFE